jgi:ATP-binding cassette subfamily F protein uup
VDDINLMRRFLFADDLPFARVGDLSGGERRRLQLLLVISGRPNVLFLDEPTNDLDLDTLRVVEDFLEDWPGALALVSHDRTFLDRTTERLVAVETNGTVSEVPGGVAGWVARSDNGNVPRTASPRSKASTKLAGPKPANGPRSRAAGSEAAALGRRVREAEKEMLRLERQRDQVREALTATVDYVELTRLGNELHALQAALDAAEEAWLALALQS